MRLASRQRARPARAIGDVALDRGGQVGERRLVDVGVQLGLALRLEAVVGEQVTEPRRTDEVDDALLLPVREPEARNDRALDPVEDLSCAVVCGSPALMNPQVPSGRMLA